MNKRILYLTSLLIFILSATIHAQQRPIGYWRSHLPYNTSVSAAWNGGDTLYVATEKSFYIYNIATKESEGFSKVEGMADVGMSYIAYDEKTRTVILAYENSNIDLFEDGSFYNLPDLKQKNITGGKAINHIYTSSGLAYVSTDAGILVIDLDKKEIKETYNFTVNGNNIAIKSLSIDGNFIYAATDKGLYRNTRNAINLQNFSSWAKLDTTRAFISVAAYESKIFVAAADTLFVLDNNNLKYIYRTDTNIRHLDAATDGVWISEGYNTTFTGKGKKMSADYSFIDSFKTNGYCNQLVQSRVDNIWVVDAFNGLNIREYKGDPYRIITPQGPSSFPSYDLYVHKNELWVAHGGYNEKLKANESGAGFSGYVDGKWKVYKLGDYKPFGDTMKDFSKIIKDNNGVLYAGSAQSGLFILKPDGSTEYYKQNSFIDPSSVSSTWHIVGGFAIDNNDNLWMTAYGAKRELVVKTKDGLWHPLTVPIFRSGIQNAAASIIVDDNNLKWYATTGGGGGVIVYDDNNTPESAFDDRYRQLLSGKGTGGLADNEVYCLAKDKNGSIWIGTKNGISIVSCAAQVIDGSCEAENRIVQYDKFAGYLFQEEIIKTIAVDGANRKWIGTNNGVWLISEEGDKVINRFTADNSPLPSNLIQKIVIDPATGDVYIGTEQGLVSYRGTATDGGKENTDVKVFPNPVKSGYNGTIAIKGLVENADVRITDISGQLVYRTKALGGQAVWNGVDYTGRRPQSGVYLVFITNKDGSQTNVAKMVFME